MALCHDAELLAVINALKKWEPLLLGTKFTICTDHDSLKYLHTKPRLTPMQHRWVEYLSNFDHEWKVIKGNENIVSDALSRLPGDKLHEGDVTVVEESFEIQVRKAANRDPKYRELELNHESLGYEYRGDILYNNGRIIIPENPIIREKLMRQSHDLIEHPDYRSSVAKLENLCYWETMKKDMKEYCDTCDICQRTKSRTSKKSGELHPLPIPSRVGQSIAMDWVTMKVRSIDPLTKKVYDTILVITDRLTRLSVLIPTTVNCTAEETAKLLMEYWYKRFGVPEDIVSDRDSRLTAGTWEIVAKSLGFERKFSTAYHPQTDGATERVNRTIIQTLRTSLHKKPANLWVQKMPEVEFAYNARVHKSTGLAPFQAAYGFIPNYGTYDPLASNIPLPVRLEKMTVGTRKAQDQMKRQYNKHRKIAINYAIGDQVMLDTEPYRRNDAKANISKKLTNRWQGPYSIQEKIADDVYKLNLPPDSKLHNAFNTVNLKPYILTPRGKYPMRDEEPIRPEPVNEGENPRYEIETITSHDFKGRQKEKLRFHILWKGYPDSEGTWEPARTVVQDAIEVVRDYIAIQPPDVQKEINNVVDLIEMGPSTK